MLRPLPLLATLGLAILVAMPGLQAEEKAPVKGQPIDVVICLDVSGSMNGLIASAKLKLWDIVNDLARIKPTPDLRVALYSYGHTSYDAKAGWVRKELDLTTDLDELYKKLNGLTTNGGTEYVTRVCKDALSQQKWSKEKNAMKLIFVCGNEPANQDPVVTLKQAADLAIEMDVVVNPIYCGPAAGRDAQSWKDYAALCKGRFVNIDQNRGTVAIATPFDKELAELSGKLNTTYIAYGREGKEKAANQVAQDANAAKLPGAAPARAASKAGGLYRNSSWDLVDKLKEDPKFDVKKLKEEELCEEMKKLKPEEREAFLKKKLAERESMQKQILSLNAKRDNYIREETKKNPNAADKAFDEAVKGALRDQAKQKGIKIPE